MKERTEKELAHFVERIRLSGSRDSAYQHLLDTLAADIEKEFESNEHIAPHKAIADFVRNWWPGSRGDFSNGK